jgi:hypothetical protein
MEPLDASAHTLYERIRVDCVDHIEDPEALSGGLVHILVAMWSEPEDEALPPECASLGLEATDPVTALLDPSSCAAYLACESAFPTLLDAVRASSDAQVVHLFESAEFEERTWAEWYAVSRLVELHIYRLLVRGDFQTALRYWLANQTLGNDLGRGMDALPAAFGIGIRSRGHLMLYRWLALNGLSTEELEDISSALQYAISTSITLSDVWEAEYLKLMSRVLPESGVDRPPRAMEAFVVAQIPPLNAHETVSHYASLATFSERLAWRSSPERAAILAADPVAGGIVAIFDNIDPKLTTQVGQLRVLYLLVACRRFQAETGRHPTSAAEIADTLAWFEVPLDPLSGQPLEVTAHDRGGLIIRAPSHSPEWQESTGVTLSGAMLTWWLDVPPASP